MREIVAASLLPASVERRSTIDGERSKGASCGKEWHHLVIVVIVNYHVTVFDLGLAVYAGSQSNVGVFRVTNECITSPLA